MAGDNAPGGTAAEWRDALVANADARLFASMMTTPSPTMTWAVDRDHRLGDLPETTFSSDALDGLRDSILLWVGTRVMRFYDATDDRVGPKHMRLVVSVELEP